MALDPVIAGGFRGLQLQDPLEQYARVSQIQQAQQQNQLAALKMQEYQREVETENRLRALYARPDVNLSSPEFLREVYAVSPARGAAMQKSALEARKAQQEADEAADKRKKAAADLAASYVKQARDQLPMVGDPQTYASWRTQTLKNLPGFESLIPADYSPQTVQRLAMDADKMLEQHFVSQPLGGTTRVLAVPKYGEGAARTVPGTEARMTMAPGEAERIKVSKDQLELDQRRLTQDARRIGLEERRVNVLEENNRRDADPGFQQRMSAARATGEAIAKGDVAAVQALPKVISRAEEGVRLIDEMIGKRDTKTGQLLKGSKPHPGFENAVGATWLPGARFIDGTDAAGFMARFEQVTGQSFLEAFESLKGGGAITQPEGEKGTSAINRMKIATDEKEFIRAAMDLQDVIRKGVTNAQTRAARAGSAMPGGGGAVDTNNPLLKQ